MQLPMGPEAPPPRLCAPVLIHKNEMFVYGGDVGQTDLNYIEGVKNDMWSFAFSENKWGDISLKSKCPQLTEHSAVSYGNSIFLFGGSSGNSSPEHEYGNTIHQYNIEKRTLTEVACKGNVKPPPRSAHSAVVYKDTMYIFGGWNGRLSCNDLYCFNFEKRKWKLVTTTGSAPSIRRAHGAVVHSHYMYIFGGYDIRYPASFYNQLYRLNLETHEWQEVECKGNIPSGRSRLGMVRHKDKIYVLGGWDRKEYFADFYEFSINTRTWKEISSNLGSLVKGIGQHSLVVYMNWLLVFGGFLSKEKMCTNKMFVTSLCNM